MMYFSDLFVLGSIFDCTLIIPWRFPLAWWVNDFARDTGRLVPKKRCWYAPAADLETHHQNYLWNFIVWWVLVISLRSVAIYYFYLIIHHDLVYYWYQSPHSWICIRHSQIHMGSMFKWMTENQNEYWLCLELYLNFSYRCWQLFYHSN